ncbi:hypothetical protein GGQ68_000730 [Sagittula marina]|uniref:Toprim domain-containing protein n=1 Tax=Sagittula marina TaxID=943940 RepID=A0A7W6DKV3_9RHOB|nr:toprim domain-containing protein [Sagittula marina]MBB3984414.1 hypothetical protein [Sagittula marina]
MNARDLTQMLRGTWRRHYGTAPCPVCQSEQRPGQNALTLSDGNKGLLAHCKKSDCGFRDILGAVGVAPTAPKGFAPPDPAHRARREAEAKRRAAQAKRRAAQACAVWHKALPISATIAETYLRGRGITCALPDTLRFHPDCWHGATARRYPAMVALIDWGVDFAVHRTYLRADGCGKADVDPSRAMLGAASGGAVRLTDEGGPLVVAEGIETALSLASGLLQRPATIWAALSTSGLRGLKIPFETGRLTIAPDGDKAGRTAAIELAERAHASGWIVSTLPVPNGRDWNDILMMKGGMP